MYKNSPSCFKYVSVQSDWKFFYTAVWEIHASRYDRGSVGAPPWTPLYNIAVIFEGFEMGLQDSSNLASMMLRDASYSGACTHRNLIKSNQNQIVITIFRYWFWTANGRCPFAVLFDLIGFRKDFSVFTIENCLYLNRYFFLNLVKSTNFGLYLHFPDWFGKNIIPVGAKSVGKV